MSEHEQVGDPAHQDDRTAPERASDGTDSGWPAGQDVGATAVEYALMVAFISIVIIATVAALGLTTADGLVVPCLNGPTCP